MSTATQIYELENNSYHVANIPIHRTIQQLIPYLEYRQACANKLRNYTHVSDEQKRAYAATIEDCNKKLLEILHIPELNKEPK